MLKKLEVIQNNIVRLTLGLTQHNHLSEIKQIIGIKNIDYFYLYFKCSLLKLLKRHSHTTDLLRLICNPNRHTCKLSLKYDLLKITDHLNCPLDDLLLEPAKYQKKLKQEHFEQSRVKGPNFDTIHRLLQEFNPSNMKKLREATYIFPQPSHNNLTT